MARQYVGIDFHRRRSVIVRMNAAGEKLSSVRIPNDPVAIAAVVAEAGPNPEVVVEATYGWYWVVDLLQAGGARVHLANPQGLNWGQRRVKNDERDAVDLADMLRLGRLPEAWIAPAGDPGAARAGALSGQARRLAFGTQGPGACGDGQRGCAARAGPHVRARRQRPARRDGDGPQLHDSGGVAARSDRALRPGGDHAGGSDPPAATAASRLSPIQAIDRVGRTIAAVLVAEIGDVGRFRSAEALCSWAGLTPKHRQSDTKTTRGSITKQGSRLVRWALIEAVSRYHGGPALAAGFRRIAERRGTNKARVAVARKVLTLVYYGLRDGEIRCLAQARAA
jgi:transposase